MNKKFTVISDPNRGVGSTEFRVHLATCRDAVREVKKVASHHGTSWTSMGDSGEDVVNVTIMEFAEDDMTFGPHDFYVCNCCKK